MIVFFSWKHSTSRFILLHYQSRSTSRMLWIFLVDLSFDAFIKLFIDWFTRILLLQTVYMLSWLMGTSSWDLCMTCQSYIYSKATALSRTLLCLILICSNPHGSCAWKCIFLFFAHYDVVSYLMLPIVHNCFELFVFVMRFSERRLHHTIVPVFLYIVLNQT